MKLCDSRKPLRSTSRPGAAYPYELIALGALLACFAIVLSFHPFVTAAKQKEARATAEQSAESLRASANRPPRPPSSSEAADTSETIKPLTALSSIMNDEFAHFGFQAVSPKDRDAEMQAAQTPQDRAPPATPPLASIVGVWAPDAGACSARYFREGMLPTIINAEGAWAGETFCLFKNQKQTETGWKVVANCSNPLEHWTTEVRLTVKDNRLMWTSKRGTQAYTRCAPDFLMAADR
jgi:hypothetical protein